MGRVDWHAGIVHASAAATARAATLPRGASTARAATLPRGASTARAATSSDIASRRGVSARGARAPRPLSTAARPLPACADAAGAPAASPQARSRTADEGEDE